ncbi:hypothetical protein IU500_11595 [Nocardia terpenica]|uniref:hypothetical protein n=1 Tax=Nocardia terpenica TaxID=455432 RepID=UPI001894618A|nr:hypothetical protein [Nocardia terpenica]MBF6062598.1 hypothetical protein [Nocardia terpenica]MBF6104686.1 hypothetical protein [Nocardia terpenica]MBF6116479.1 hypothetical protein [Nocardia terpenica]MBF6123442.1 hypothetical protein [Nocardia terpenica]MBF6156901.1 hypothetical protein [Nocardia terpenica]
MGRCRLPVGRPRRRTVRRRAIHSRVTHRPAPRHRPVIPRRGIRRRVTHRRDTVRRTRFRPIGRPRPRGPTAHPAARRSAAAAGGAPDPFWSWPF